MSLVIPHAKIPHSSPSLPTAHSSLPCRPPLSRPLSRRLAAPSPTHVSPSLRSCLAVSPLVSHRLAAHVSSSRHLARAHVGRRSHTPARVLSPPRPPFPLKTDRAAEGAPSNSPRQTSSSRSARCRCGSVAVPSVCLVLTPFSTGASPFSLSCDMSDTCAHALPHTWRAPTRAPPSPT